MPLVCKRFRMHWHYVLYVVRMMTSALYGHVFAAHKGGTHHQQTVASSLKARHSSTQRGTATGASSGNAAYQAQHPSYSRNSGVVTRQSSAQAHMNHASASERVVLSQQAGSTRAPAQTVSGGAVPMDSSVSRTRDSSGKNKSGDVPPTSGRKSSKPFTSSMV